MAFTHRYQQSADRDRSALTGEPATSADVPPASADVGQRVVLVVDVANVMGCRPDGWWRDRAAAASRILAGLAVLPGAEVAGPDGGRLRCDRVVAVVEGRARRVPAVAGVEVVRAERSGDDALVAVVHGTMPADRIQVAVVTADRGLRARLPAESLALGPGWLRELLDRLV